MNTQQIYFPSGFPCVLFCVEKEDQPSFFLARSEVDAAKKSESTKAYPVKVFDLVMTFGHKETNQFLKNFGKRWTTKEGMIFYEKEIVRS